MPLNNWIFIWVKLYFLVDGWFTCRYDSIFLRRFLQGKLSKLGKGRKNGILIPLVLCLVSNCRMQGYIPVSEMFAYKSYSFLIFNNMTHKNIRLHLWSPFLVRDKDASCHIHHSSLEFLQEYMAYVRFTTLATLILGFWLTLLRLSQKITLQYKWLRKARKVASSLSIKYLMFCYLMHNFYVIWVFLISVWWNWIHFILSY